MPKRKNGWNCMGLPSGVCYELVNLINDWVLKYLRKDGFQVSTLTQLAKTALQLAQIKASSTIEFLQKNIGPHTFIKMVAEFHVDTCKIMVLCHYTALTPIT